MVSSSIEESETSPISANSAGCIPTTRIFRVRLLASTSPDIPIKLSERSLHSAALEIVPPIPDNGKDGFYHQTASEKRGIKWILMV